MATDQAPTGNQTGNPSIVEETRKRYLPHEKKIRAVSLLYWLGAVFGVVMFLGAIGILLSPRPSQSSAGRGAMAVTMMGLSVVFIVVAVWLGLAQRKLKRWTKILTIVLSAWITPGSAIVAFGDLMRGAIASAVLEFLILATAIYVLYLIFSRDGRVVYSEDYAKVIAATTHIK